MNNYTPKEGITDARQLGMHKYIILGIQHLFAMGVTLNAILPGKKGMKVKSVHDKEIHQRAR